MKKQLKWLCPLLFIALLAPFTPWLDLEAARFFYQGENVFYNSPFFRFMYVYGEVFGFIVAFALLTLFLTSFISKKLKKWRPGASAILLTLIVGAGIIVNLMFKEYWGRPRPKQVIEFGGNQEYRAFWQPKFGSVSGDHQKSFPSGHSAMGFYYLSMILVGRRYRNRAITYTGAGLTTFWGGGLMLTRVVQGGHFVSDVVISPVIMWSIALLADRLAFEGQPTWEGEARKIDSSK